MADHSAPSILYRWDGESFSPATQHLARLADKHFVVGEAYRLEVREDRSSASHNHYFASLADAHQNLPESLADRFPTPDHLRRWALIKAGYRDERSIVCASKAEAQRLAAFVKPMDDYAVILARDAVVIVYTAKSQSVRAMGKETFQKSKDAVLEIVSALIGSTPADLSDNAAGKAA